MIEFVRKLRLNKKRNFLYLNVPKKQVELKPDVDYLISFKEIQPKAENEIPPERAVGNESTV